MGVWEDCSQTTGQCSGWLLCTGLRVQVAGAGILPGDLGGEGRLRDYPQLWEWIEDPLVLRGPSVKGMECSDLYICQDFSPGLGIEPHLCMQKSAPPTAEPNPQLSGLLMIPSGSNGNIRVVTLTLHKKM